MNNKITLHFAHANGFPASSYQKLWRFFPENFEVIAHQQFGHQEHLPVNENWQNQVTEFIHYLEETVSEPVYAVGHSFGGVISFMSCCTRPDLFKGLILLDPPMMVGPIAPHMFKIAKKTALIDKITPSGKSRLRKSFWRDGEDPLAYFRPKALFKDFDPDCLRDYVEAATEKEERGTRLSFKVDVETAIFRHIPHNLNRFKGKLNIPAKLFSAQYTNACFPPMVKRMLKHHKVLTHELVQDVGHMFPFEKPEMTANLISKTILGWEGSAINSRRDKSEPA